MSFDSLKLLKLHNCQKKTNKRNNNQESLRCPQEDVSQVVKISNRQHEGSQDKVKLCQANGLEMYYNGLTND